MNIRVRIRSWSLCCTQITKADGSPIGKIMPAGGDMGGMVRAYAYLGPSAARWSGPGIADAAIDFV
jgi:hypothetical protein